MDRKAQFIRIAAEITDNEAAQVKYAEHLCELFDVIDAHKIGVSFKTAVEAEDFEAAIKALAKYYRGRPYNTVSELSADGDFDLSAANRAIEGHARVVNIDWKFENGEIDFLFDPTQLKGPRNHEWLWQFNRHNYWENMARAYVGTGDEKYTLAFENQLLKWIAQTYIPEKWNDPGSAWRTIECGIRLLGFWQVAYDGFRRSTKIHDVSIILMIASMHRQSIHLVSHPTRANWLMMEMNGVYTFSALFPELTDSEKNRTTAVEYLLTELKGQILPDGMHNELSPDYQRVVFECACNFYSLARSLGFSHEVPEAFVDLIRSTVNAAICLSTPALTQPKTNDCFTTPTNNFTMRAATLLGDTPEYKFINTARIEGNPPKGNTASIFLPYAGFVAMRSDWGPDATYLCFDVGPLGMAHMHQDKLNINLFKGNEELIFDDGGGQYEISAARVYALSGYGHNTVLVDGMAQCRKLPLQSEQAIDASWISNPEFDYAVSTYEDGFGDDLAKSATHKREIRFCKPHFFCVTDTLISVDGQKHDYEVLFHLDTTKVNILSEYKNGIISDFGRKYELVMIPLDCESGTPLLKTVSAVTEPQMQGWYNGRNDTNLHEAITISREIQNVTDYRFTTLLFPIEKGQQLPRVDKKADGVFLITFAGTTIDLNINALDE